MQKIRNRTLTYRRVSWLDGAADSMQRKLSQAHQRLQSTQARTFQHGDGEIQGIKIKAQDNALLIHLTEYTPHQPTSLVPFASSAQSSETSEKAPPKEHHYLEGDIFFLVRGNHVILCPSGARESVAESYIRYVLRAVDQEELITRFDFTAVANVDKVKLIRDEGVKKIGLKSSLYEATDEYIERKTTKVNLLNSLASEFMKIFGEERSEELSDIESMENLSVKLEISFDQRRKGGDLSRQRLQSAASKILGDADPDDEDTGFTIETTKGNKMTAAELRISDKRQLPAKGNSIFCSDAFDALVGYYEQLREQGVLEQ